VKIVITVGLPGSGKSTYLRRRGVNAISSDDIRQLITDDPADQDHHARAFAAVRYLVRQRLAVGRPVTYVDATNLMRWERKPYILMARRYRCRIEALFFDVPLDVCIVRNQLREQAVPVEVIRLMAGRMEVPVVGEGFDQVIRPRMHTDGHG
jgi:predicted kinase